MNPWYLAFAVIVFIIIFELANIAFIFMYSKYDFKNNLIISEIENILNTKLIYNLELKDFCSEDEEILIMGEWEGTTEGCLCDDKIYRRTCKVEDINNKCLSIKAKEPKKYEKINSKYICIKRLKKYIDYLKNNQIISKTRRCFTSYKECGIINPAGKILCVKDKEKCPITINDINIDYNFDDFFSIGYNHLKDNNNGQILGILKLGQYFPCIYPKEENWTYHYELEASSKKCMTQINNVLNDNRYEELINFTTTKYQLYKDNNIMDFLPYYNEEEIKNEAIYLYGRTLYDFDINKIKDYSYDKLISLQKVSNISYICLIITSCLFVLGVIAFSKILYNKLKGVKFTKVAFYSFVLHYLIPFGCFFIIMIIIQIIIIIIICSTSISIKNNLDIKGNDIYINALIDILMKGIPMNFYFSLSIIIWVGFIIISIFITGIYASRHC